VQLDLEVFGFGDYQQQFYHHVAFVQELFLEELFLPSLIACAGKLDLNYERL
jgi:hypothetical protein